MNRLSRLSFLCLIIVVGIGFAACGSSNPTAPTAGPAAHTAGAAMPAAGAAVPPASSTGATIQGTVLSAAAASSAGVGGLRAFSAGSGIRVSVVGSSLVTLTDASGRFVLSGVPSGQVELQFEGHGIDARLQISGLVNGQTLTITVNVTGGSAVLMPDEDDKNAAEFHGSIDSIDLASASLMVSGRKVTTDTSTKIVGDSHASLTLSDLMVGQKVEVTGTAKADSSVLAQKIQVENDGSQKHQVEFHGSIESIGSDSLMVSGRKVATDASTKIVGDGHVSLTLSDLMVGQKVEVTGTAQADNSVLAQKIEVEQGGSQSHQVEFHGSIESIGSDSLMVSGRKVTTDTSTKIGGDGHASLTLSDLKIGEKVEVTGTTQADGSVLAQKIQLDD